MSNKTRLSNNNWLSTSAHNENGCYNGGFDGHTNKWYANVYPNGKRAKKFSSISHRRVDKWLTKMAERYEIK